MRSLRSRLLAGMLCGIALLLGLFGVGVYGLIRRALVAEFDASLVTTARTLAASVERDGPEIEIEIDVHQLSEFKPAENPSYFVFRASGQGVLQRSPSLGADDLPELAAASDEPTIRPVVLPTGRPGRAVGIRFFPAEDPGTPGRRQDNPENPAVTLIVARGTDDLAAKLLPLRWVLTAAGAGVMAVALLVASLVVRRGLRPLGALAGRIASMNEGRLEDRVPVDKMPTEMIPVGEKLNDFLERLEAAFKRERAFSADVAHELRTPLAGVLSTIEVALLRHREPDEYRRALSDCLEITRRLQSMVNSLLTLVRFDAGRAAAEAERIELRDLAEACWKQFADRAASRGVAWENGLPADLSCVCPRPVLAMLLRNLLENAAEYTDKGGRISVAGGAAAGSIEVAVSNTGAGLSQEDLGNIFNPFWRADPSRTDTGVHCGLGLTVVRRCVRAIGGEVTADLNANGVFAVTLVLPSKWPAAAGVE